MGGGEVSAVLWTGFTGWQDYRIALGSEKREGDAFF
jgi:hypothetical protein